MLLGPIDVPNRLHPVLLLLSTAWALAAWAKRHPGLASSHLSSPEQIPRAFTAFLSLREPDPCPGCSLLPWERWLRTDPLSARPALWGREGAARGCGALKAGNTGARLRALRAGRVGGTRRSRYRGVGRSSTFTFLQQGRWVSSEARWVGLAERLNHWSSILMAAWPVLKAGGTSPWSPLAEVPDTGWLNHWPPPCAQTSWLTAIVGSGSHQRKMRAAITWHLPSLGALSQPQNGCGAWSTWWRGPGWVSGRMWR